MPGRSQAGGGRYGTAVKGRDAVHAAAMLPRGLTHIISADRHLDVIEGITRVDPHEAVRRKR